MGCLLKGNFFTNESSLRFDAIFFVFFRFVSSEKNRQTPKRECFFVFPGCFLRNDNFGARKINIQLVAYIL